MLKEVARVLCFVVVLRICLVECTDNYDTKAKRNHENFITKHPLSKDDIITQDCQKDITEVITRSTPTDRIQCTESPSTTSSRGLFVYLEFSRSRWISLIACLGVILLIITLATGCFKIRCDNIPNPYVSLGRCEIPHPPEAVDYGLDRLTMSSSQESDDQEQDESECERYFDSLQEMSEESSDFTFETL